jgi:hypothetical protein
VARQVFVENQQLQGRIDAVLDMNRELKQQLEKPNPLEVIKSETKTPTRLDYPFELPPVLHTHNRWTNFFDALNDVNERAESVIPSFKQYFDMATAGIEYARNFLTSRVTYECNGPYFTETEESELPDLRPIEHLVAPLCRAQPRLMKVLRKQGKMERKLIVSATAVHELVYRFPTVNKIEPSDVASVLSRMQGLNICNATFSVNPANLNGDADGVGSHGLSSVIHDTVEYFLAWHYHNVESRFQNPWVSEVSLGHQPGGSGNGCSVYQSKPAEGWSLLGTSSMKCLFPRLPCASLIFGLAWYMILLSLVVVLCKWLLVLWLAGPLCQWLTTNTILTSSGLLLSVSVLLCPRWLRNTVTLFVVSCVTGCVRTLFRSSLEIAQDLKTGLKSWIDQRRISRECVRTTRNLWFLERNMPWWVVLLKTKLIQIGNIRVVSIRAGGTPTRLS